MMYESPIEVIYGQLQTQMEDDVFRAVQNCGIRVDKDELIKALKYDRDQYAAGYADAMATLKYGHWIEYRVSRWEATWSCSECGTLGSPQWKCCPVCTAFMDRDGVTE